MSARSHAMPCTSIFAHCAAVSRIDRCSSFASGGVGGRPIGFFGCSMGQVYVIQKVLAMRHLLNHNNYTPSEPEPTMNRLSTATKFDDRMVDFLTGRKVSPAMEDRKVCDCCGQRIVKGFFTNLGTVGDDCHEVIRRAQWLPSFSAYADDQKRIGWSIKPAIAKFLQSEVFA